MRIYTADGIYFDTSKDPGKLIIEVQTENDPNFGVFSGKYHHFGGELSDLRQPTLDEHPGEDNAGFELFEITPVLVPPKDQVFQYPFMVLSLEMRVYFKSFPKATELYLQLKDDGTGSISFGGTRVYFPGFTS